MVGQEAFSCLKEDVWVQFVVGAHGLPLEACLRALRLANTFAEYVELLAHGITDPDKTKA